MGTIIAQTPASAPANPARPPTVDVAVRIVNVGPNIASIDVTGVTNGEEFVYEIARSFRGLAGYADSRAVAERLDCRIVAREAFPRDDNEVAALFKGPTRRIQKTDKFPDASIGFVPNCYIFARVRPATWLGTVEEAVGDLVAHYLDSVASFLDPITSYFSTEPIQDDDRSKAD